LLRITHSSRTSRNVRKVPKADSRTAEASPWRFAVIPSPAFTVAALSSALHNHVPTAHKVFELITVVDQFVAYRHEANRALIEFLQPATGAKLGEIEFEIWRKQLIRPSPSIDFLKVGFCSLY
jgi:hypothetical protein